MKDKLALALEQKIKNVRAAASRQKEAAKQEGIEVLYDVATGLVGGTMGALEGSGKAKETFEAFGYQVPTKLAIGLFSKGVALATKGHARKAAQETARFFVGLQAFTSAKKAAEEKLAEEAAKAA